jgi:hypothetical protein
MAERNGSFRPPICGAEPFWSRKRALRAQWFSGISPRGTHSSKDIDAAVQDVFVDCDFAVLMGCSWACSGFPKTSFRPATRIAKGAATAMLDPERAWAMPAGAFQGCQGRLPCDLGREVLQPELARLLSRSSP